MGRVSPSPYLLGLPIRDSMALGGLRMGALSPILSEELETEGLEAAEGGSILTTGLEGSRVNETTGAPPGFEPLPLGAESSQPAEPELSIFDSPLCFPSGLSWNENNTTTPHEGELQVKRTDGKHGEAAITFST